MSKEEVKAEVEEIKILKDSKIIDKGEVVTEQHIAQLDVLGLQETSRQDINFYLGLILIIFLVLGFVGVYLYTNEKSAVL